MRTPQKEIFKGRTLFIVALIATGLTFLTVYLTGINFNRSLTSNLYISLSIIAVSVFSFLTYGLYNGIGVKDNPPELKSYEPGVIFDGVSIPDFELPDVDDGIGGIILSILLWIVLAITIIVLLLVLEALFWLSLFIIFSMLYWVFIRAIRLMLFKARKTKGDMIASLKNAFFYTTIYTGWMFVIAFIVDFYR